MRGHEKIIAMRKRGKRPTVVFIDCDPDNSPLPAWRDWNEVSPGLPSVQIDPDDVPHRLDLRFVIGMIAIVSGSDPMRVRAVEFAAREHGAERVIGSEVVPDDHANCGFVTTEVRDSKGCATWPN